MSKELLINDLLYSRDTASICSRKHKRALWVVYRMHQVFEAKKEGKATFRVLADKYEISQQAVCGDFRKISMRIASYENWVNKYEVNYLDSVLDILLKGNVEDTCV